MGLIGKLISWLINFLLGRSAENKIKGIENEAKSEVDKLDDGQPIADYLNE